jgi:hypothetical protein
LEYHFDGNDGNKVAWHAAAGVVPTLGRRRAALNGGRAIDARYGQGKAILP